MNKDSKKIIKSIVLILTASFMFVLANPNYLIKDGLWILSWLYFLPVVYVINKNKPAENLLYGFFYGFLSYFLYVYWLKNYSFLIQIIACFAYGLLWSLNFVLCGLIYRFTKIRAWILQWLYFVLFEYVKTLGFMGFGYGIIAYTQWKNIRLIQISDITGIYGVSALVMFPSFALFRLVQNKKDGKKITASKEVLVSFGLWFVSLIAVLFYGNYRINQKYKSSKIKIAAIQNNDDPWSGGVDYYREKIQSMIYLTEDAMDTFPDIELVVWPETAVVPSIEHFNKNIDERRHLLVSALMNYLDSKNSAFLIGNAYTVNLREKNQKDYNSALLFIPGKNILPPEPYVSSKIHLVPFSESFPYEKTFPYIYKLLVDFDTHFWDRGEEIQILQYKDFCFGAPICFEDTFSDITRKMCLKGADGFVNLSNDSWSESIVCQNQHLSMAVFRSVENKVSTIRSTATGQTCHINKFGQILQMSDPFCQNYICSDFEYEKNHTKTFYTMYGDVFIYCLAGFFVILLLKELFLGIIKSFK